ncbi:MAG: sulfur carrier protein ThiS [Leptospiraceae bacterium]|nr:sulfur carrier protein ThiS [Leptospiraceae bacterium]
MVVNGKQHSWERPANLMEFVESLGLDPRTVAVERNGAIVRRETWPDVKLEQEDRLEIIRFVGGG